MVSTLQISEFQNLEETALQQKLWSETGIFEYPLADGEIARARWVDKPGDKNTFVMRCALGTRAFQIVEIVTSKAFEVGIKPVQQIKNSKFIATPKPPQVKITKLEKQHNKKPLEFIVPKHPKIDFNVPIVLLNPDSKDYQKHLNKIAETQLLVIDIETFGDYKNAGLHPRDAKIRLIQLFDGQTVWIADLGGRDLNALPLFAHLPSERALKNQKLQAFLSVLGERLRAHDCLIVGHNLLFDLRILQNSLGLKAKKVSCTQLGTRVYFGDYGKDADDTSTSQNHDPILKGGYGLANLVNRFFDTYLDKTEQTSDWGLPVLSEEQIYYAAKDVIATHHLHNALVALYEDKNSALYSQTIFESWQVENACLPVTVNIENNGLPFDKESALRYVEQIEEIKTKLLIEWSNLSPNVFYTQNTEFSNLLKTEYNIEVKNVDKAELTEYLHFPIVRLRGELKALDGLLNNLKGFLRSAERDGKVHTSYRTLTGFGRFSSGESKNFKDLPNLQAVSAKRNPLIIKYDPPNVRRTICPPEGYTMGVIDLAGAHGRIAADQTDDETSIAACNDDTIDNHSKVAVYVAKCQQLDWDWKDIAKLRKEESVWGRQAKDLRDTAKNTYYGWLNCGGPARIKAQIKSNTGIDVSIEDCKAAIEGCKQLFPGVMRHRKNLLTRLENDAVFVEGRLVVISNTSDGFRLLFPLTIDQFNPDRLVTPYQVFASIWTRIEASAVKRALAKIQALIDANPQWDLQIIGIVHDEVDLLVKTEFEEVAITTVNNIVGDEFQKQMKKVKDGRETNWEKLKVKSWADK